MQMMGTIRRGISSSRILQGEVRSSGGIINQHVYRADGSQSLPPMISREGLKTRWGIMRGHLKSGVCAGIIQKQVPAFHASKFPAVANGVFKEFWEAHRKGDKRALAAVTTEELYATLKNEMKVEKKKGARRAAFRLLNFKDPTRVLQMRVARQKQISPKEGWGQVTCRLCSERELVWVDAYGKEVRPAGSEGNKRAQFVTVGVFEVFFGDSAGRWRLALMQEVLEEAPASPSDGPEEIPF